MLNTTCCLPRWTPFGLLSAPSRGWAHIITTLILPIKRPLCAAHSKQHVCASVVLANEPLLTEAILGAAAFAAQVIVPQEKALRVVSTWS
jgi:hypothetical protein